MTVHYEIEQHSEEWFRKKWGKVGGTASSGLFVKSDTLFYDLLAEQTERFDTDLIEESFQSDAMIRGTELEPEARKQLEIYTGLQFLEAGWIQNDIELIGISPDGITADLTAQCEIKCPQAKKHLRTCIEGIIPLDNINQCIHAFAVNSRLETLYFMSYRPESIKPIFVKELKRNDLINIGTKARPIIKTVDECVTIIHSEAKLLEAQLKETINNLNF